MKRMFIWLLLILTATAKAEIPLNRTLVSGNALITPSSIEKVVKQLIINKLKDNFDAQSSNGGLSLKTDASEHHLRIPEKAVLQEILRTLGISNKIQIVIEPINTSINFGSDSLKIKIVKTASNFFSIHAHWEIKELKAESKALKILVPKGLFDTPFVISSSPIKIGLNQKTGPITADVALTASLSSSGTKINLVKFDTNLDDSKQKLRVKLGKLTVNGKPLELEIKSNGQSIIADEPTIRAEFQNFEPELMKSVQKQLGGIIQKGFADLNNKLEDQDPFMVSFNSSEILDKYSLKNPAISTLFKDIKTDFFFSYIQELPNQNLFTTQVSSGICIGTECITNRWQPTLISVDDTTPMIGEDTGVILYESWVQNVINSEAFQKRVRTYYKNSLKSPGVFLGKQGIKIHFNPSKNAIVAVLNLMIDIKATADAATAMSSWSNFKNFTKKQLADAWENVAGSGQYVYLPVEITIKINGTKYDAQGKKFLELATDIPFHKNGTITNSYGYPSNVKNMNATIRKELLSSVQSEIGKALPSTIKIDLEEPIEMDGIKIDINQVKITKNKGLLVSGCFK